MGSTEENDSDISSITDDEKEDDSIDTSVSQTSLKTTPIGLLDVVEVELEEIDVIEDDITEIAWTSKEKTQKYTELCSKMSFTRVSGYGITPNQSVLAAYFEKQIEQGYLKRYNNIIYDKKLKRFMKLEEGEYLRLNLKGFLDNY